MKARSVATKTSLPLVMLLRSLRTSSLLSHLGRGRARVGVGVRIGVRVRVRVRVRVGVRVRVRPSSRT